MLHISQITHKLQIYDFTYHDRRAYEGGNEVTLLIMAAGMGSRYGGLKQIDPVGEHGELIIDYSVHDAIKAGFDRAVFVISRDMEKDFCDIFFNRIKEQINAEYVFQEIPKWRKKPFGTTSALLAAKDVINEPFCVINADDLYGRDAFKKIANFLKREETSSVIAGETCLSKSDRYIGMSALPTAVMVAYKLKNTVSDFGTVSRGTVVCDGNDYVRDITERICMKRGSEYDYMEDGAFFPMDGDTKVSMNFFGFTPEIFPLLDKIYQEFLEKVGKEEKAECFLSENIGRLIKENNITVKMLRTYDKWMGFTYRADKDAVAAKIKKMNMRKIYPSPLW